MTGGKTTTNMPTPPAAPKLTTTSASASASASTPAAPASSAPMAAAAVATGKQATAGVSTPSSSTENSDDVMRRRVRFDADADLRLLLSVRKRAPYAADHGMKLKAWEDVADEVYTSAAKLQDLPSSRRSVTDRFQLLLQMYGQGTLKLNRWMGSEGNGERAAMVENALREISEHIATIKDKKWKKFLIGGPASADLGMEMRPGGPHANGTVGRKRKVSGSLKDDSSSAAADTDGAETDAGGIADPDRAARTFAAEAMLSRSVYAAAPRAAPVSSTLSYDPAVQNELLAMKREKLALKRRKLELLAEHHKELVALEYRRLALEEARHAEQA